MPVGHQKQLHVHISRPRYCSERDDGIPDLRIDGGMAA